jgi:hypothetical protein
MLELFGILIVSSPKTNIAKKTSRLLQFHLLLRIHSLNLFGADQSSLAALMPVSEEWHISHCGCVLLWIGEFCLLQYQSVTCLSMPQVLPLLIA